MSFHLKNWPLLYVRQICHIDEKKSSTNKRNKPPYKTLICRTNKEISIFF